MGRFYVGAILTCFSAVGFGLMPILALYVYRYDVNVMTLLFLRFTIAALCFFGYMWVRRLDCRVTKRQFISLLLLGGVLYTLQSTFYFSSVRYIPASLAALLLYIYPVFVSVLAVVFEKEKPDIRTVISVVLAFTGLVIVLQAPLDSVNYWGMMLAIGAALIYSCYIVIGNQVVAQVSPVKTSAFVTLFASLALLGLGVVNNDLNLPDKIEPWLLILGVALISTVLAILTFFAGVNIIGSTKASIISTIEPLITIACSTALFQESLTWLQWTGGLIVLTGTVLVIVNKRDREVIPVAEKVWSDQ